MSHDFDLPIDRVGSDSIKWNRYGGRDVIPMWIADMDFVSPPAVIEALHRRVGHGVFGYGGPGPSLVESVLTHLHGEYGWTIEPSWIVWLPGLVTGLNVATRSTPGNVFTATPVYPPFLSAPRLADSSLVTTPLLRTEVGWQWDFTAAEAAIEAAGARLWLLCHPHNPVGRAWTDAELASMAELAERHSLIVCSDEIHCDLVLTPERRHRPFAMTSDYAQQNSITLMAPSKTFNVAGLGCAFAIVPDADLRRRFRAAMDGIVPAVNVLALAACEAALRDAGEWRRNLLDYLRGNHALLQRELSAIAGLTMHTVEATYLAWIGTEFDEPAAFFEAAGVGLSSGRDFGLGDDWRSYVRLNFGCPRAMLEQAIERIAVAMRRRTSGSAR
jgi:cystathionine beta-lyase